MDYFAKIIEDIECQDVAGIRECFEHGVNPNSYFRGEPLIYELISEYGRGPKFRQSIRAFVEFGLQFEDQALLSVLLDDPHMLSIQLAAQPQLIYKKYSLRCAYTPLFEVSLLHICAEFNHLDSALQLVSHGSDPNGPAGFDEFGFGGQTPIFHTVNQNGNHSVDMLNYFLSLPVDVTYSIKGLIWGKSYPWETLIPAVNPISYAMMGLLPQMHRAEKTITDIVSRLLHAGYGINYQSRNIPNAYLNR
jgi:ankyrin repeat protein